MDWVVVGTARLTGRRESERTIAGCRIWTLRKYVDSIKHREEDAAAARPQGRSRQGIGDGDDEVNVRSSAPPAKIFECRVCGHRGSDDADCPDCLAATMVEVPPETKPGKRLTSMQIVEVVAGEQVGVVRDLFQEYEQAIGVDLCFQGFAEELASLPGAYGPPRGKLLLAIVGDRPVGCVALRPIEEGVAEMKRLYVRPAGRGHGCRPPARGGDHRGGSHLGYRQHAARHARVDDRGDRLYRSLGFVEIPAYRHNPLPGPKYFELVLQDAG